jgi:hypothetical protein
MKKFTFFLFITLPILSIAQQKMALEFSAAPNYSYFTKPIINGSGRVAYDFGVGISATLKNEHWQLVGGLRFANFSTSVPTTQLRWGTQHNGSGGFDPNLPSLENVTSAAFKSNYFFVEMPLGIRLRTGNGKLKFIAQATAGPTMFLTNRTEATYDYVDGTSEEHTSSGYIGSLRRFNAVGSISAGIELKLSERMNLHILPHGDMQALSIAKESTTGARFYSAGLRVGMQYALK